MLNDAITLTIGSIFGAIMLVVVLGFYLLTHRNSRSPFEAEDYYRYDRGNRKRERTPPQQQESRYTLSSDIFESRFRFQNAERSERYLAVAIIFVALAAIALAIYFGVPEVLLLFFVFPIVLRLIRSRRDPSRKHTETDSDSRSSL